MRKSQTTNQQVTHNHYAGGTISHITIRGWLIGVTVPLLLSGCLGKNVPTVTKTTTQPTQSTPPSAMSPRTTAASLLALDPATLTPDLVHELQTVTGLAHDWHKDAVLYALTVAFPTDLAPGHAKRVYIFGSAVDPTYWWTVAVNEQTSERIRSIIPKEDYLGSLLPPAATQYWKINVVQALQIAETAGGTAFRQSHPGSTITAALAQQGPNGWLWWTVTYRGGDHETVTVRVHPGTGLVYDDTGQPVMNARHTSTPSVTATQ